MKCEVRGARCEGVDDSSEIRLAEGDRVGVFNLSEIVAYSSSGLVGSAALTDSFSIRRTSHLAPCTSRFAPRTSHLALRPSI